MKRIKKEKLQSTIFAFSTVIPGRTLQTIRIHDIKSKLKMSSNQWKAKKNYSFSITALRLFIVSYCHDGKDRDG